MTNLDRRVPSAPAIGRALEESSRRLGLADDAFQQRRPLRGQITKREVRAVALYSLGLRASSVVWDIGAGTGSVSVEAGTIAHQGRVFAVERDEDSIGLLRDNVAALAPPNVEVVIGEAPDVLDTLPDPDSVFVGGSGGRLKEILDVVNRRLKPRGTTVVNLAVLERANEVYHYLQALGFTPELTMVNAARGRELKDGTVRLEAMNPVFVIAAGRGEPGDE